MSDGKLDAGEVLSQLSKLALYPSRRGGNSIRIEGGPLVGLYWGREGIEVVVSFRDHREIRMKARTASTGRSSWTRERTHRLEPGFAEKLATAIANNPEGRTA